MSDTNEGTDSPELPEGVTEEDVQHAMNKIAAAQTVPQPSFGTDPEAHHKSNPTDDARKKFLRTVADKVLDKPDMGREDTYATIAQFWNAYLHGIGVDGDIKLEDYDVALMMDLFKTARLTHDPHHEDSWVDKAGYIVGGHEKAVSNYPKPQEDL